MQVIGQIFSTALLVLMLAGAAQAAELFTSLLFLGDNQLRCTIVNVSDQPQSTTIQPIDRFNNPVSGFTTILDPGEGSFLGVSALSDGYCKFMVSGKKEFFRANAVIFQPGVGTIAVVPAQ